SGTSQVLRSHLQAGRFVMGWHRRVGALAVAVAFPLLVPVASGIGAVTHGEVVPAKLVGKWTRTVTPADVTKSGAYGVQFGSTWTLTVKKSGAAIVGSPNIGPPFTGKIVSAGGGRVHINLGPPATNVWKWSVSGRALSFTKVKDGDPDRVAVFAAVWRRK